MSDSILQENELLKAYDEQTKKKELRTEILKLLSWGVLAVVAAIYFGNMFFGQSSFETLISLQNTKKELEKRIAYLKGQNAVAQKDYFELKGLYPDEK
ncbi:hypothetical protein DMB92_07530 [Campylobacter sp. MIT 99-7217]|nr:hypothetical protein DMB92_07530 [Campylobacter sp. MIT 99-7217]